MGLNFSSIRSLASIVNMFAGADPVKAEIIPLDDQGRDRNDLARAFQYFPESISDSKGVNYATKNIPGGSHPLYQFINGTDRTISFTAIFTSDEDPASPDLLSALQGGLELNVQDVTKMLQPRLPNQQTTQTGITKHNAPVESAVVWLRSLMYPRYSEDFSNIPLSAPKPPPVIRLYLPNSGVHGTTQKGQLVLDSVDCLMTQCDVVYDAFYRNGKQRITTVSLTFNETIQTGHETWGFADGAGMMRGWLYGQSLKGSSIPPYNVYGSQTKLPDTNVISNSIQNAKDSLTGAAKGLVKGIF